MYTCIVLYTHERDPPRRVYTHTYIIHTYIIHIHTHIHTYIHTYIHTHIHTHQYIIRCSSCKLQIKILSRKTTYLYLILIFYCPCLWSLASFCCVLECKLSTHTCTTCPVKVSEDSWDGSVDNNQPTAIAGICGKA